jgi:hypothetical protein
MDTQMSQFSCLAITGHHRSGTSLVSSLLQSAGLHVGTRLLGINPGQKYGHFEDMDFLEFHIDVLTSQGACSQGYILQKEVQVQEQYRARAQNLVEARMGAGIPWGWKDPRTTLFLKFWKDLIPGLGFLFVYRSPWEVVDSLFRRGDAIFGTNPNLTIEIWKTYNQAILDFADQFPDQCLVIDGAAIGADRSLLIDAVGKKFGLVLGPMENRFDKNIFIRHASSHLPFLIRHFFPEAIEIFARLKARAAITTSEDILPQEPVGGVDVGLEWALQHWHDLREAERKCEALGAELSEARANVSRAQANTGEMHQALGRNRRDLDRVVAELEHLRSTEAARQAQIHQAQGNVEQALQEKRQAEGQAQAYALQLKQVRLLADQLLADKQQAEGQSQQHLSELQQARALADQLLGDKQQTEARFQQAQGLVERLLNEKQQIEAFAKEQQEALVAADCNKRQAEQEAQQHLAKLLQAQAALAHAQSDVEAARREKDLAEARLRQHESHLAQTQTQLVHIHSELERASHDHSQAVHLIHCMESSKFWKIRRAWIKAKGLVSKLAG